VITNISWDHKELLGDTLPLIAGEKAGIIKPGIPVVISERQAEVEDVFVTTARRQNAPIFFASDEYSVHNGAGTDSLDILRGEETILRGVNLPLKGLYQKRNVPGVMKTIDILVRDLPMTGDQIKRGLEDVIVNTSLKGRWQQISSNPTVVCDTGHNFSGVQEVLKQIFALKFNRLFVIWGMVKDKDVKQILRLLPTNATYYFCQSRIPRALDADVLQQEAAALGLQGEVIRDVNEAKRAALAKARADDLIFIGGSTYIVAEIDEL
jgi:dihydrofolate synthase/folylpolyglutamate synthase